MGAGRVIQGVIFDLGSTLFRFAGAWPEVMERSHQVLLESLRREGVALENEDFATTFKRTLEASYRAREVDLVERTTASLLREVMARLGHGQVPDEVVRRALEAMYAVSEAHWLPMPGLHGVLEGLREAGYRMALVSNAGDEDNVRRLIDKAELGPFFDPILISAAVGIRKPDPRLFEMVLRAWDLQAPQVVMVGDSLGADILGAQRAGLRQIWLTAEAETPENQALAGSIVPEAMAATLDEIPAILQRMAVPAS